VQDGIVSRQSELVVSVLKGGWRDVESVNIDHAMNPWMAAYVGMRRFPNLLPAEGGAWLLWEEKLDPHDMDPPLGRLCAWRIGCDGPAARPVVAVNGRCMFPLESGGTETDLLVASRTQFRRGQQHLPYILHRADLTRCTEPRPDGLESNRAATQFTVRPVAAERPELEGTGMRLFFGDVHLHSHLSQDPDGEQDELYHFARDVARLDFAAFTENDFHAFSQPFPEADWQRNRRSAEFFHYPGAFTVLLGWEYTRQGNRDWGDTLDTHRCVLFPGSEGEVYTWRDGRTALPRDLVSRFRGRRVLLHHHHPMGYDITDDSLERNIEICSGWWNCMERPEFAEALHGLLRKGFRLGLFGASDNHERNPGLGGALTGVWAKENTREGIFEAFRSRRIFATTGLRPDLRLRVSGAFMGSRTRTDEPPNVQVHVRCEVPVSRVEILRDGELVHTAECGEQTMALDWRDETCALGRHFYYAHVLFEGREANPYWNIANAYGVNAWTSPVWVTYSP